MSPSSARVQGRRRVKTDVIDLEAITELALAGHRRAIADHDVVIGELSAWAGHRSRRITTRTATKNQLLGQLDRAFPGLTLALPDVLGTKIGRLVAAEFSDPSRLAALGVNRLIRFAALTRIFRDLSLVGACREAKVHVLQGIIGLLYGSIVPTRRHFAGEEYRGRTTGESVRRRPWCRVACRDGHATRARRPNRAIGAGHRRVGRHLPRPWLYAPGEVFADLAAAVADGADCIDGVGQLCGDREHAFEAKASTTTMWRLVDQRIDAAHLPAIWGSS